MEIIFALLVFAVMCMWFIVITGIVIRRLFLLYTIESFDNYAKRKADIEGTGVIVWIGLHSLLFIVWYAGVYFSVPPAMVNTYIVGLTIYVVVDLVVRVYGRYLIISEERNKWNM